MSNAGGARGLPCVPSPQCLTLSAPLPTKTPFPVALNHRTTSNHPTAVKPPHGPQSTPQLHPAKGCGGPSPAAGPFLENPLAEPVSSHPAAPTGTGGLWGHKFPPAPQHHTGSSSTARPPHTHTPPIFPWGPGAADGGRGLSSDARPQHGAGGHHVPQFPWGEAGLCVPMGQQGGSHSPPPPSRVGRELREIQQNAAAYPAPWAPSGRARGARLSRRPIAAMPSSAAAPAPWGAFWPLRPDPEVPLWGRAHGGQLRTPPAERASRVQLLGRAAALPSRSPPVPPRCVINIQPQRCAQPSPISCLTLGGPRCTELRGRFCLGGGGRGG